MRIIASILFCVCYLVAGGAEWFVRPLVHDGTVADGKPNPQDGIYGSQDGTSYTTAFNGLYMASTNVYSPDDTLWVCGDHILTISNATAYSTQGDVIWTNSNVKIRGDYPGHSGMVCGASRLYVKPPTWYGPDANGVYHRAGSEVRFQLVSGLPVLVYKQTNTTWEGDAGFNYYDGDTNWFKPHVGATLGDSMVADWGFAFILSSNVTDVSFVGLRFICSPTTTYHWPDISAQDVYPLASSITFSNCTFSLGSDVSLNSGNDDWTFTGCTVETNRWGFYAFTSAMRGANRLTVSNCTFRVTNTPEFAHQDGHAIGIQGGSSHRIIGNTFTNIGGSCIEIYNTWQTCTNGMVLSNSIAWTAQRTNTRTGLEGLALSGNTSYLTNGQCSGWVVAWNTMQNLGIGGDDTWQGAGVGSNWRDYITITNNTVYTCGRGLRLIPSGWPVAGVFVNNAIFGATRSSWSCGGNTTPTNIVVDYNIYWPTPVVHGASYPFESDANSITNDPLWLDPGNGDLRFWAHSPLRTGGVGGGAIGAQPYRPFVRVQKLMMSGN